MRESRVFYLCFLKILLDSFVFIVIICFNIVLFNVKNLGDNERKCIFVKY